MEQELHTQRSWPIEKCSSLPLVGRRRAPLLFLLGAKIAPILCTRCLHCLFKIYEVAMKAWRIVKCCDTQFHVKDARKNAFVGRATSWNFFGRCRKPFSPTVHIGPSALLNAAGFLEVPKSCTTSSACFALFLASGPIWSHIRKR